MGERRARVLLAEDEPVIAFGLEEKLRRLGYDVVGTAGDGETALELAGHLEPDLLLLDIKMPRLSGLAVAERLAGQGRSVPTVIISAFEDADLVERAIAVGVAAYLVKPVSEGQLATALRLAASRFAEFRALESEVESLKQAIEARKLVERAKGLLMDHFHLSESEAFARLQREARDRRIPMVETARRVIDAEAVLKQRGQAGASAPSVRFRDQRH
ncbi:MAG: response regulator [Actinobacteria bacterium]|nr:response regulator [Actinomycetota bacterium]